jgi:alpha-tubulin suppressor-like RCC1 family protein
MISLFGVFAILAVVGTAVVLNTRSGSSIKETDIIHDYKLIKDALEKYRINKSEEILKINQLEEYISESLLIPIAFYEISADHNYLTIKKILNINLSKLSSTLDTKCTSDNGYLNIQLNTNHKVSKVTPVANFKIFPEGEIFTTTRVKYDTSSSICEDQNITEFDWDGNFETFDEPGEHIIRLRIKDKNDNWSDYFERKVRVTEKKGIKGIAASHDNIFVLHFNGKVQVWGNNEFGQLCTGKKDPVHKLTNINISNISEIAPGKDHTILRTYDGKLFSCGKNMFGQLGDNTRNNAPSPVEVWGMEHIISISAGDDHSGAISASNDIFAWGLNEDKQLGLLSDNYKELPQEIMDIENIIQISFGENHSLAMGIDGAVYSWGNNEYGQLGNGMKNKFGKVTLIGVSDAKYIFAGSKYSVVVNKNGDLVGFGNNKKSQLGIEAQREVVFPKEILGPKKIVKVVGKKNFTAALDEMGNVYYWGEMASSIKNFPQIPLKLEGIKYVKDIAATSNHIVFLSEDDKVLRWSQITKEFEQIMQ